jgi:Arc/MetJ-type ribon-helix-helix transcriptional regulator
VERSAVGPEVGPVGPSGYDRRYDQWYARTVSGIAKVTISLPTSLVRFLERERVRTGASRSALVARALREMERSEGEASTAEAYRRHPETADEIAFSDAAAAEFFAEESDQDLAPRPAPIGVPDGLDAEQLAVALTQSIAEMRRLIERADREVKDLERRAAR